MKNANIHKRMLALLLALVMVFLSVPTTVFGDSGFEIDGLPITAEKWQTESLSADIYWVDNNLPGERPSHSDFLEFYLANAQIKAAVADSNGTLAAEIMSLSELAKKLNTDAKDLVTIVDAAGTGHYQITIKPGVLPISGTTPDESETGKTTPVTIDWQLLQPMENPEGYYFVDKTEGSGSPCWYYLKTHDFQIQLIQRSGDQKEALEGLKEKILETFSFYWKEYPTDDDEKSLALSDLLDASIQVEFKQSESSENGEVIYTLTIHDIPKYRTDGTVNEYYIGRNEDFLAERDKITGIAGLTAPDYLQISYENDEVANVGTIIDRVFNGGDVILTLKGETDYKGHKMWGDAGYENAHRPDVEFQLWRYTKKDGEDFKHAAPVKNEKGEILLLTVDSSELAKDSFEIDFHGGTGDNILPGIEGGNFLLAENEILPKYDPEGYEYVYFSREVIKPTDGADNYTKLYGEIVKNTSGTLSLKDTLPDGVEERTNADASIYNDGTILNRLSGSITTEVEKNWKAAAFQDSFQDVRVEMKLQSKVANDETGQWGDVIKDGKEVTVTLEDFTAEQLSKATQISADKYDYNGQELEYRWVETAIYQGDSENLLDENNEFSLHQSDKDRNYISESETVKDEISNTFKTVVTNRLQDTVNYQITKQWMDKDGNLVPAPSGAEVMVQMYRQNFKSQIEPIGDPVKLDGIIDQGGSFDVTVEGSSLTFPVQFYEGTPWVLSIDGLPKYDRDGHEYTYIAMEKSGPDGYTPQYSVELVEDTYQATITNGLVGGKRINVKKNWVDDSDTEHRGTVIFTVYEREGENKFKEVATADINAGDFWWKEVPLSDDVDLENIVVLETAVVLNGKTTEIPCEDAQLEKIYQDLKGNPDEVSTFTKEFQTEEHRYRQYFSITNLENSKFYTVTNRRLGVIDLTVTKQWRDGIGATRQDFLELLNQTGATLGVKLICTDKENAVHYEDGTVNIGGVDVPILDHNGNPVSAIQQINPDQDENVLYFYNLPKYDEHGIAVHYTVEEVVIYGNGATESFAQFKAKHDTIYSSEVTSSDYVTGKHHTHDTQEFFVNNTISGQKDVTFYKLWLDAYRNEKGERPDLSLDIYQQLHNDPANRDDVSLLSFYRDYRWEKTDGEEDLWKITLTGLPKYDRWGYEINYYAKENVNINRETFDYMLPTYRYTVDGIDVEVGAEDSGLLPEFQQAKKDYVIPLPTEQNTHLLKEEGTFVNQIAEDVLFKGEKIWQLIPGGFATAHLPSITFSLWQGDDEIAHVTISSWQQLSDGSYQFAMEYLGENKNSIENGKLVVTDKDSTTNAPKIPQYDEYGNLYTYTVKETVDLPDGTSFEEIYTSNTLGSKIYNTYNSDLGNLTVKKYTDALRDLETGEKYPTVSFTLERYYRPSPSADPIKDTVFSTTEEIPYQDFMTSNGLGTVTFEDLPIYAPNGQKWLYVVTENTDSLEGYDQILVGKGNLEKDDNTMVSYPSADPIYVEAMNDVEFIPDVTFQNIRNDDTYISITGLKHWQGSDPKYSSDYGIKPTLDEVDQVLELVVIRYANAQANGNSIPEQIVPADQYTVEWSQDTHVEKYRYTIRGKDGSPFEQYAPNGMPWKYKIKEVLKPPYNAIYKNSPAEQNKTTVDADGNITIEMNDLRNQYTTQATGLKKWVFNETTNSVTTDYLGYQLEVKYVLQAKVTGIFDPETDTYVTDETSPWYDANTLFLELGYTEKLDFNIIEHYGGGPSNGQAHSNEPDPTWLVSHKTYLSNWNSGQKWNQVGFYKMPLGARVKANPTQLEIPTKEDDIVTLKYRVVERELRYYKGDSQTPVYTQEYRADPYENTTDPVYSLVPEDSEPIFGGVSTSTDSSGNYIRNQMPTVQLEIWKHWEQDNKNQSGTRPGSDGLSKVFFVIQRRAKGSQEEWQNVQQYDKNGTSKDLVRDLNLNDSTASGRLTLSDLPQYDFDLTNPDQPKRIEYEYRARELVAGAVTSDGVQEDEIVPDGGRFNQHYTTTYQDGGSYTSTTTNSEHRPDKDTDYVTHMVNTLNKESGSLPDLGGIGSIHFYAAGGALVLTASLAAVIKKRKTSK
ncbi:hypothetical protein I4300191C4_15560 [Solibaculum mannosilyticum]